MPVPVRQVVASPNQAYKVLTTDDGSRTLIQAASEDAFHSGCGALAETRHVYLANSGVAQRLSQGQSTRVLELGLGSAMAMLCTLDAATKNQTPLEYVALENQWISTKVFRQLLPHAWVEHPKLVDDYMDWRESMPEIVPLGHYHWHASENHHVTVVVGDAIEYQHPSDGRVNVVYFDPFSPASAPELWGIKMLSAMHAALDTDGRLVTYCVNRQVRDTLKQVGFDCTRVPGPPGGKREVLVAYAGARTSATTIDKSQLQKR